MTPQPALFRLNNTLPHDPAIDAWFAARPGELGTLARHWFTLMRACGDEVRELLHDGCPHACCGNFPFAYVHVFTVHINLGFFRGASLPDPAGLLEGTGKHMRHIKLRPGTATNPAAVHLLIQTAYSQIKSHLECG